MLTWPSPAWKLKVVTPVMPSIRAWAPALPADSSTSDGDADHEGPGGLCVV